MKTQNFETKPHRSIDMTGYICEYKASSNIAFVKYWGKHGRQLPMNPSLSMTLSRCFSETKVVLLEKKSSAIIHSFKFQNEINKSFSDRIEKYMESVKDVLPWLNNYNLDIESANSFPHSAGIASSASAFAALAGCLYDIHCHINHLGNLEQHLRQISSLARLGSGSACRSIFSNYAVWGKVDGDNEYCDQYALPYKNFHESFKQVHDSILIISSQNKDVSSSLGHSLMHGHLYKDVRYQQAKDNLVDLMHAMKIGDWENFGAILETEALTLHALMMTSSPSYFLLESNSIIAIKKIKDFRNQQKIPMYFTIDAGPNIHLIYPDNVKHKVQTFIEQELKQLCAHNQVIYDSIGSGLDNIKD